MQNGVPRVNNLFCAEVTSSGCRRTSCFAARAQSALYYEHQVCHALNQAHPEETRITLHTSIHHRIVCYFTLTNGAASNLVSW